MDFFETLFGWNLDGGSGTAEWLVVAAVVLAVTCVLWLTGRRGTLHRSLANSRAAGRGPSVRLVRRVVVRVREG